MGYKKKDEPCPLQTELYFQIAEMCGGIDPTVIPSWPIGWLRDAKMRLNAKAKQAKQEKIESQMGM